MTSRKGKIEGRGAILGQTCVTSFMNVRLLRRIELVTPRTTLPQLGDDVHVFFVVVLIVVLRKKIQMVKTLPIDNQNF